MALGSNLGDRMKNLNDAESRVASAGGIYLDRASPTYESPPAENENQPKFLNRVLAIETWLTPRELLTTCKKIEAAMGRDPAAPTKGPRVIDIDILLYGDLIINEPDLQIPHAALFRRPFFLKPLKDLTGDFVPPGHNRPLSSILADLAPYELVKVERSY